MRGHLLVLAGLVLLVPAAAAGSFGSTLRSGDVDYVPTAKADSKVVSVNEGTFGTGAAKDNCVLLDIGTPAAGAHNKDIRLTPCFGKAAGTQIVDSDVVEKNNAYPQVAAANVQYADVNHNGKYDAGDYVYLTTRAAPGLDTTGAAGTWTIRLTPAGEFAAGTFALPGDSDFTTWSSGTAALTSSIVERDDGWFMVPVGVGVVLKYGPIPANSIRLLDAPAAANIQAASVKVTPTEPASGEAFVVVVEVKNNGKVAGSALITTTLAGKVVDARGTPVLAAGKSVTLVASLAAPAQPGVFLLQVGNLQANLTVVESSTAKNLRALQGRIALLEETLGQSQWGVPKAAAVDPAVAAAPYPSAPLLIVGGVLVAWAFRRRRSWR